MPDPYRLTVGIPDLDMPYGVLPVGCGTALSQAVAEAFLDRPPSLPVRRGQLLVVTDNATDKVWGFSLVTGGGRTPKVVRATEASVGFPTRLRSLHAGPEPDQKHYKAHRDSWYSSLKDPAEILWVATAAGVPPRQVARAVVALWREVARHVGSSNTALAAGLHATELWAEDSTRGVPQQAWKDVQNKASGFTRGSIEAYLGVFIIHLIDELFALDALARDDGALANGVLSWYFHASLTRLWNTNKKFDDLYNDFDEQASAVAAVRSELPVVDVLLALGAKAYMRYFRAV